MLLGCLMPKPVLGFSLDVPAGTYVLDKAHAYINFSYSHLGFSTPTIGFRRFDVVANVDAGLPANSTLEVTIDPSSIDSRLPEFDEKLRSEAFFHTEQFPTITFLATEIEMVSADRAKITGDLTLKGRTGPVVLDVRINKAALNPMSKRPAIGLDATAQLKRSEWDLGAYAPEVGDLVTLEISLELNQQLAAPSE
jgi:polyisoprenoid-binding protein YceI